MGIEQASPTRVNQGAPEPREVDGRRWGATQPRQAVETTGTSRLVTRAARQAGLFLGAGHWAVPWLAELLRAWPPLTGHLLDQAPAYVHYLCIVALHRERLPAGSAGGTARWLAATARRDVLKTLGIDAGPALLAALERLPGPGRSQRVYRHLLSLVWEPAGALAVRHMRRVSAGRLETLGGLAPDLRSVPWLQRVSGGLRSVREDARSAARILAGLGPERRSAALQALGRVRDVGGFGRWEERWKRELAFPPPPWPGTDRLRPITTAKELVATARAFRNCLEVFVDGALAGDVAHYRWHGAGAGVVVQVERTPDGWRVTTMAGPGNGTPRARLRRRVYAALAEGGIRGTSDAECKARRDRVLEDEWQ